MDMALGYDHTVVDGDGAGRADEGAAGSSFGISGLADHSGNSKLSGVGHGDFQLGFGAEWTKDRHVFKGTLGALDSEALLSGILSGLA